MSSLRDLLKGLARASRVSGKHVSKDVSRVLQKVETGIPSVDHLFRTATVTRSESGIILIDNAPANRVYDFVRKGDLVGLLRTLKSTTIVTAEQASAFHKIVSDFPEVKLAELDEFIRKVKMAWPDLDVTTDQLGDLPKSAQSQLASMTEKLYKHMPKGAKVTLIVGGFVMGANWLKEATEARRGCFMFKNVSGKMTSCRINSFSCSISPRSAAPLPNLCQSRNYDGMYNTTLVLMVACQNDKSDHCAQSIASALDMQDIVGKFEEIYKDESKYLLAAEVIERLARDNKLPKFRICDVSHPAVEQGVVTPCRMCDSSADPKSTAYIDPSQYADSNIAFRCNANPSIIDTIADIMQTKGVDLLDGLESTMYTILKPFVLAGLTVLCILFIIGISLRFFKRKAEDLISLDDDTVTHIAPEDTPMLEL